MNVRSMTERMERKVWDVFVLLDLLVVQMTSANQVLNYIIKQNTEILMDILFSSSPTRMHTKL